MMTAPIIHEITAAGPATRAAAPEPNSQPEPIKELKASITPANKLIFVWRICFPLFSTYGSQNIIIAPLKAKEKSRPPDRFGLDPVKWKVELCK